MGKRYWMQRESLPEASSVARPTANKTINLFGIDNDDAFPFDVCKTPTIDKTRRIQGITLRDPNLHELVKLAHKEQMINVRFQCSEVPLRVLMPKDQITPALVIQ
ncbi:hypothetical protein N7516_000125 [Penicillium verrucosum]|uniref:uncharacterized protein n=1 Tax=Penicillium verrucosum TaxID=60171 RepID=UPI002544FBE3|nr:uncharacterized protein N7516_000125 [Penicillium verrucosum]KAJ5939957.1 hypothetical protein N7516_000125 [Penicillium verrucosum]